MDNHGPRPRRHNAFLPPAALYTGRSFVTSSPTSVTVLVPAPIPSTFESSLHLSQTSPPRSPSNSEIYHYKIAVVEWTDIADELEGQDKNVKLVVIEGVTLLASFSQFFVAPPLPRVLLINEFKTQVRERPKKKRKFISSRAASLMESLPARYSTRPARSIRNWADGCTSAVSDGTGSVLHACMPVTNASAHRLTKEFHSGKLKHRLALAPGTEATAGRRQK